MRLYSIEAGHFKLDGGAMFGVVPKVLWERTNPADKNNQIEMATRCLLVEDHDRLILIDTGMGNKQSEKFFGHYNLWGTHSLDKSLSDNGFHRDEITDVFLTHLHFDHCGGAINRSVEGLLEPAFKNAIYWVHKNHWRWAVNPNVREKASFLCENIMPIKQSGQLKFIEGNGPLLNDLPFPFSVYLVDGHTEKQMLPIINYKRNRIIYAADLIPTVGHLPTNYIMGYDTRPLKTLTEKTTFLKNAVQKNTLLFMEHDPFHELVSLKETEKGIRMDDHFHLDAYFS
ncbi:MBL fold metallo-hydrolase [Flavobacteriaceae bacterium]|nr:MBL fold metallo-hydrolase [Flavobacteriaceae bacterium]